MNIDIFERNIKLYLLSNGDVEIDSKYLDIYNELEKVLGNLKHHKLKQRHIKSIYENSNGDTILKVMWTNTILINTSIGNRFIRGKYCYSENIMDYLELFKWYLRFRYNLSSHLKYASIE